MAYKSRYFSKRELRCKCGCGKALMDDDFMRKMDALRREFKKPIFVTSAYRCPEYNKRISSTGLNGPHTTGKAMDIPISGRDVHALISIAITMGFTGIGLKQKGPHRRRFAHLDTLVVGTRPWIWTY